MADIIINGTEYKDVPSIEVPSSDGSVAEFKDRNLTDALIARTLSGSITYDGGFVGTYAFSNCPIEEIEIPSLKSEEGYYRIGNYAFYQCSNLTKVTSNANKVGYGSFYLATSLSDCDFPNLINIDYFSFYNCYKLEKFDCYKASYIGDYSFQNSGIKALILGYTGVVTLGGSSTFKSTPISQGTGYIYVPSSLLDSYKTATNWSVYADQFRALEDYTVDGTTTGELDESKI